MLRRRSDDSSIASSSSKREVAKSQQQGRDVGREGLGHRGAVMVRLSSREIVNRRASKEKIQDHEKSTIAWMNTENDRQVKI